MAAMIDTGMERQGSAHGPRTGCGGRLLLASRSPRRRTLLTEFGVVHDAEHPGFDDAVLSPGDVTPAQWVASLAYMKAMAGRMASRNQDRMVLGADTVCVRAGRMLGTPVDAEEARNTLRALSGGSHEVLTGVAMIGPGVRIVFVDSATVRVGVLEDAEIDAYVEGGQWQGKAGAYNLAERLEAGWPIEYVGDPTTIMGLPMGRLMPLLRRSGVVMMEGGLRA